MIHYHGTPIGGQRPDAIRFLSGRHALVPFGRDEDLSAVMEACQSFVLDNGAFTAWRQGKQQTWEGVLSWANAYIAWVQGIYRHPGCDWALIPDVIDGTEEHNDRLIEMWPGHIAGVPVWHLHESLERLEKLTRTWPIVALGSSGQWATLGTARWWDRMSEAMEAACDAGVPRCKLHGLRMLDPAIFHVLPLASADSTNAARNKEGLKRFGQYKPPTTWQRAEIIASRIESHQSAAVWRPEASQLHLFKLEKL